MSLFIIICSSCGKEIPSVKKVNETRKGETLCEGCSKENWTDTPFN